MERRSRGVVPFVRLLSGRRLSLMLLGALCARGSRRPRPRSSPSRTSLPGCGATTLSDLGDGKGVQRYDIEIVGVLQSYAPKQDLVLARVLNEAIEKTGIIAGMSGSPVYVDGKLVGALAYGWPFSREPICGITPIQSMLDIRKAPAAPPVPIGGAAAPAAQFVSTFGGRDFAGGLTALLSPLKGDAASAGPVPLPLPVSFTGASTGQFPLRSGGGSRRLARRAVGGLGRGSSRVGSGHGRAAPDAAHRLEPGSAVAAVLLSGDMVLSATGTVTWVDGNSILAFGHPFLSMGPVDMPMAQAEVLTVLPSLYRSFKFSTTGSVLGSISQDRSTGILGSFGKPPTMVPVTIRMTSEDVPTQTFKFEVVHNSMLTPILRGARDGQRADDPGEAGRGTHDRLEVGDRHGRSHGALGLGLLRPLRPRGSRGIARAADELPHGQ